MSNLNENPWEDDSKRGRSPPNRTRPDYFNVTLSTMGSLQPRNMTNREIEETESPLAVLIGGRKAAEDLGLRLQIKKEGWIMKPHYFEQTQADEDDVMLKMCKQQGYVPKTCLLGGIVVWSEVGLGHDPCGGCKGPRDKCHGRPEKR